MANWILSILIAMCVIVLIDAQDSDAELDKMLQDLDEEKRSNGAPDFVDKDVEAKKSLQQGQNDASNLVSRERRSVDDFQDEDVNDENDDEKDDENVDEDVNKRTLHLDKMLDELDQTVFRRHDFVEPHAHEGSGEEEITTAAQVDKRGLADLQNIMDSLRDLKKRSADDDEDLEGDIRSKREAASSGIHIEPEGDIMNKRDAASAGIHIEPESNDDTNNGVQSVSAAIRIQQQQEGTEKIEASTANEEMEGESNTVRVVDDDDELSAAETGKIHVDEPVKVIKGDIRAHYHHKENMADIGEARVHVVKGIIIGYADKSIIDEQKHKNSKDHLDSPAFEEISQKRLETLLKTQQHWSMPYMRSHSTIVVVIAVLGSIIVLTMFVALFYCFMNVAPRRTVIAPKA